MSFLVWPLAASALRGTWGLEPQPDVRMTDYPVGPKTGKPRFERLLHEVRFEQQLLNGTDFATFGSFYATSLRHGTDKFVMPIWDGEEYFVGIVKFVEPYSSASIAPDLMRVSFRLQALDLPLIDDAAVWMLSQYPGEDIIAWSDALHIEVHVHYPDVFLDQAAIWMLQNYQPADIVSWSNSLHTEVHVHYPSVWPLPPSP